MNQSSTRSPGGRARPRRSTLASFFEALLRLRVGLGVDRPRLLPGGVEPAQQPPAPALAVAHAEAALDQPAQVAGAPGDAAVALQPRAPQDQALQGRLPALVQGAGSAGPRPVAQALDPSRVVAVHPVAQGLPVHAGRPRRLVPAHPVQGVGQRQQAATHPPVPLAARHRAQLRGRPPRRDRHGDHGPGSRLAIPARSAGRSPSQVKTSYGRYQSRADYGSAAAGASSSAASRMSTSRLTRPEASGRPAFIGASSPVTQAYASVSSSRLAPVPRISTMRLSSTGPSTARTSSPVMVATVRAPRWPMPIRDLGPNRPRFNAAALLPGGPVTRGLVRVCHLRIPTRSRRPPRAARSSGGSRRSTR